MTISVCERRSGASRRSIGRAALCAAGMSLPGRLAAQGLPPQASSPEESSPQKDAAPELEGSALESPSQPKPEAAGPREPGAGDHTDAADFGMPHYDQGFVLIDPVDPERVPYRLKLNHVSQFKYSNTLAVDETYTDHLGRVKPVQRRNDIQLARDVFYFSGYAFSKNLDFNILLYTSSATLSATAAGYVGYVFSKGFALRAGFFSLPSLRSMTGTYPYFPGTDRSLAVNYARPGFTQGIWADGELFPGVRYIAMLGNSLNTLDIKASIIDDSFALGATIWYDLNEFGKPWNDFENHSKPAVRVGTAFTFAREDRLSNLSTASPENNATFISDGNLLFETGALAEGVTIELSNFYLWAFDAGVKYRGFALNAEVYQRWLNEFDADGPLPIDSMHDWGFEASLSYFPIQSRLETYVRTSMNKGPFATAVEGAVGLRFYPFDTRNVWLDTEGIWIENSPFGSLYYIYSVGQTGFLLPVQFLLRF
jgi:hypothetical protein